MTFGRSTRSGQATLTKSAARDWDSRHWPALGFPSLQGFASPRRLTAASRIALSETTRQLVADIANAYRELGGGPVAVRSSATAEDGIFASFAGQQETILGVTGENAVVDAIGRCWASLESARAQLYRQRQGLTDSGLAMGVVVQRLVPAEVSGVLFTRDPNDPDDRRMLVEASWGLGESIVSGRVSPDRYSLDAGTRAPYWSACQREAHDDDASGAGSRAAGKTRRAVPG